MPFPNLKHFSRNENWGEPDKISHELLFSLDTFRELLGSPVVITCGTQGVHTKNSRHYIGCAVDIVIPDIKIPVFDLLVLAFKLPFTGIGYYSNWKYKKAKAHGFHFEQESFVPIKKTWMGVELSGNQVYLALSEENLSKYKL